MGHGTSRTLGEWIEERRIGVCRRTKRERRRVPPTYVNVRILKCGGGFSGLSLFHHDAVNRQTKVAEREPNHDAE